MKYKKNQLNCISTPPILFLYISLFTAVTALIGLILLLISIVIIVIRKIKKEKVINNKVKKILLTVVLILSYFLLAGFVNFLSNGYFMNIYPIQLAVFGILVIIYLKYLKKKKLVNGKIIYKTFFVISILLIVLSMLFTYFTFFTKERVKNVKYSFQKTEAVNQDIDLGNGLIVDGSLGLGGYCGGGDGWY